MGTTRSDCGDNAPRGATILPGAIHPARQARTVALLRCVMITAALLALLPMFAFACGAIVNGLGRAAVRFVLSIGIAALALDAFVLMIAVVALAVTALRPGRTPSRGAR